MNEAHYVLIVLIIFLLWVMNVIRLVPKNWGEKKAKNELGNIILRDTNKGIFK